jgi:AraC-like DNA-binding protein
MSTPTRDDIHGLVKSWERGRSFQLEQIPVSPGLEDIVERFWIASWDIPSGQQFVQEVLPHPSVNLVVEPRGARIWGVPTERDVRELQGSSWAIGAKFRIGMFTAATGIEAAAITDGSVTAASAFGPAAYALERMASADVDHDDRVAAIGALLAPHSGVDDPAAELVAEVVVAMRAMRPDARIGDIAALGNVAPRTLQRLFRRYVGVGPKWVQKRERIHLAAERLTAADLPAWTELALDLGYYDHAHFIRDFRGIVGRSPAEYAAEATVGREAG